jgi:carbonic anhydrase
MRELKHIFENNQHWAEKRLAQDPDYFMRTSRSQAPPYLWIGCSDSRIPANEVVGLDAGEVFVHRNVANMFIHTDFSALSVLEFAVDVLKVQHVIVCGHYGCGGIKAAMETRQVGLLDNWLRHVRDVQATHRAELESIDDLGQRYNRLAELNTLVQARNVCHSSIIQSAWARKQPVTVHGWVYDLRSGLLNDLDCCISESSQIDAVYATLPSRSR